MGGPDQLAVSRVELNHRALLVLCDLLEGIADRLPGDVDRGECLILSRALAPMLQRIQSYEETVLFPALVAWNKLLPDMAETIDRLKIEHQVDGCYAEDVEDMLRSYGESRPSVAPDAAGFMLRGFFESLRRHVAFEQVLLVPLLQINRPMAN
jgi:hemerythrin-like domain-containing protein